MIASASTTANLIPPGIMAVVDSATGNVWIGGLFLAGVVPGVLIGIGRVVSSDIRGPVGVMKKRAPFTEIAVAAGGAALPLVIPVIIMGGILAGWLYSLPLAAVAGASALGWLVACLRGPEIVAPHITAIAGSDAAIPR